MKDIKLYDNLQHLSLERVQLSPKIIRSLLENLRLITLNITGYIPYEHGSSIFAGIVSTSLEELTIHSFGYLDINIDGFPNLKSLVFISDGLCSLGVKSIGRSNITELTLEMHNLSKEYFVHLLPHTLKRLTLRPTISYCLKGLMLALSNVRIESLVLYEWKSSPINKREKFHAIRDMVGELIVY
jgi:hypothetical protein